MNLPTKINWLMARKGLSGRALATALGVSNATVSGWLKSSRPHASQTHAIAEYFGVTIEDLLDDSRILPGQFSSVAPVVASPVESSPPPVTPVARQNEHPAMNQAADALRAQAASIISQAAAQAAALVAIADQIDREPLPPPSILDTPASRARGDQLLKEMVERAKLDRPFGFVQDSARSA